MTRYARKHSVKGTTKREPEAATPWNQMVAHLQNTSQSADVEDDEEYVEDAPDAAEGDDQEDESEMQPDSDAGEDDDVDMDEEEEHGSSLKAISGDVDDDEKGTPELISSESESKKKKKKKKKVEKCKVCGEKGHRKMDCERVPEERRKELKDLYQMKIERKGSGVGRKKTKNKNNSNDTGEDQAMGKENSTQSSQSPKKSFDRKDKGKTGFGGKPNNKKDKGKWKQAEVRDRSGAIVEEGETLFQGFRVTKEDRSRLMKLYKQLKAKGGMSKDELDKRMKQERRIAEKRLARVKKIVCFNCRKPGHQLADCPQNQEMGRSDSNKPPGSGICFKCGSLEHMSKDCKSKNLKRENAYKFAVCFICKEEGHLAKACPDNPRGLYPRGGGCIFCGSVEHLKRDCPRKAAKDLAAGVSVQTLQSGGLEDEPVHFVGRGGGGNKAGKAAKKAAKVVSF